MAELIDGARMCPSRALLGVDVVKRVDGVVAGSVDQVVDVAVRGCQCGHGCVASPPGRPVE
eukprot:4196695-Amphidinium_carterae.1